MARMMMRLLYFVKEVWPKIQIQLNCKLYIVGINPPPQIQKLASESIIVTGFVPNLEEYYNNCRISLCPHRYAAGIPLKLIEAMSYGIPSVVSDLLRSIKFMRWKRGFNCRRCNEFAKKIIRMYQNEHLGRNSPKIN